jgi:hypothetical protein
MPENSLPTSSYYGGSEIYFNCSESHTWAVEPEDRSSVTRSPLLESVVAQNPDSTVISVFSKCTISFSRCRVSYGATKKPLLDVVVNLNGISSRFEVRARREIPCTI